MGERINSTESDQIAFRTFLAPRPPMLRKEFGQVLESVAHVLEQCLELEQRLGRSATALENGLHRPVLSPSDAGAVSDTIVLTSPVAHAVPDAASLVTEALSDVRQLCRATREMGRLWQTVTSELAAQDAFTTGSLTENTRRPVLIVDDSQDVRDSLAAALQIADLDAITASDGLEALIAAYNVRPCAVIMDVTMPVLDGIASARLLKASAATRHIPLIAYTATPSICHRVAGEQLFAHVFIKPVGPEVILGVLQRYVAE